METPEFVVGVTCERTESREFMAVTTGVIGAGAIGVMGSLIRSVWARPRLGRICKGATIVGEAVWLTVVVMRRGTPLRRPPGAAAVGPLSRDRVVRTVKDLFKRGISTL
jgi:hypothetical protein